MSNLTLTPEQILQSQKQEEQYYQKIARLKEETYLEVQRELNSERPPLEVLQNRLAEKMAAAFPAEKPHQSIPRTRLDTINDAKSKDTSVFSFFRPDDNTAIEGGVNEKAFIANKLVTDNTRDTLPEATPRQPNERPDHPPVVGTWSQKGAMIDSLSVLINEHFRVVSVISIEDNGRITLVVEPLFS